MNLGLKAKVNENALNDPFVVLQMTISHDKTCIISNFYIKHYEDLNI